MKHFTIIVAVLFAIAMPLIAAENSASADYTDMTAVEFEKAILDIIIKHPEIFKANTPPAQITESAILDRAENYYNHSFNTLLWLMGIIGAVGLAFIGIAMPLLIEKWRREKFQDLLKEQDKKFDDKLKVEVDSLLSQTEHQLDQARKEMKDRVDGSRDTLLEIQDAQRLEFRKSLTQTITTLLEQTQLQRVKAEKGFTEKVDSVKTTMTKTQEELIQSVRYETSSTMATIYDALSLTYSVRSEFIEVVQFGLKGLEFYIKTELYTPYPELDEAIKQPSEIRNSITDVVSRINNTIVNGWGHSVLFEPFYDSYTNELTGLFILASEIEYESTCNYIMDELDKLQAALDEKQSANSETTPKKTEPDSSPQP